MDAKCFISFIQKLLILNISIKSSVSAWDLSAYGISEKYYVSSIASYGNRAFLSLPRSSCHNNVSNPTLVEVSWYSREKINFARKKPYFIQHQTWNDCECLQDAIFLDVELLKGRLWALDKGNEQCRAKIVIYSMLQKLNYTVNLPEDVQQEKISSLIVDGSLSGPKAYIGLAHSNSLLIFSFDQFKWRQINLESVHLPLISTEFMTPSRTKPFLYLTGSEERGIFSLDLNELRQNSEEEETEVTVANVTFLGEKLGASSAFVADLKEALTYYVYLDYAVVRWDTGKPPEAEYYSILAQSSTILPFVSQLFTGPQNGIWALVNYGQIDNCNEEEPGAQQLTKRLVKILKYNLLNNYSST